MLSIIARIVAPYCTLSPAATILVGSETGSTSLRICLIWRMNLNAVKRNPPSPPEATSETITDQGVWFGALSNRNIFPTGTTYKRRSLDRYAPPLPVQRHQTRDRHPKPYASRQVTVPVP